MNTSQISNIVVIFAIMAGCSTQMDVKRAQLADTPSSGISPSGGDPKPAADNSIQVGSQTPPTQAPATSFSLPSADAGKPLAENGSLIAKNPRAQPKAPSSSPPPSPPPPAPAPAPANSALPEVTISSETAYTPIPSVASSSEEIFIYPNFEPSSPTNSDGAQLKCLYAGGANNVVCRYQSSAPSSQGENVPLPTDQYAWTFRVTNCPMVALIGSVGEVSCTPANCSLATPATLVKLPDFTTTEQCISDNSQLIFELQDKRTGQTTTRQILDLQLMVVDP